MYSIVDYFTGNLVVLGTIVVIVKYPRVLLESIKEVHEIFFRS